MAKKFKIKSFHAYDLRRFFSTATAAELRPDQPARANAQCAKIATEIENVNQKFEDLNNDYYEKTSEMTKEEIKKINKNIEKMELFPEEKQIKAQNVVQEVNEILKEKFEKLYEEMKVEEEGDEVIEVVIESNDRFTLLKEVCEKHLHEHFARVTKNGTRFYNNKPLPEIFDAIDTAVEA